LTDPAEATMAEHVLNLNEARTQLSRLVAQAMVERLTLVTSDRRMEPCGIDALWAERRG